ncbi:hypothetical protein DFH11DRAFT_43142 [Phellopilus nigrolimitatus]|nr:hypothetical protein DFH11DRAFT_43142 [Phellopilus nigrolimitatus]
MLYDPSTNSALHAWLVKTLEPICDAEPEALATYIVALLKHDVPEQELRQEVVKQLDEFFENGASAFIDTLFAALRSKSYIPYSSSSGPYPPASNKSQDTGIPIPLDALISPSTSTSPDRGTKRSLDDEDRESRGPPKGPRLSNEAYFSRNSHANGHGQADNWQRGQIDGQRGDYGMNGGLINGTNGHGGHGGRPYQAPNGRPMLPRGVCRDYHLKGFCSRGVMCKFSHDDAVFPPQVNVPLNGGNVPFANMYNGMPFGMNAGQTSTYDPNDSRMDMRPRGTYPRVPIMPRTPNGTGDGSQIFKTRGELPVIQDLTPARSRDESLAMDLTPSNDVPSVPSTNTVLDIQMQSPSPVPPNFNGLSQAPQNMPQNIPQTMPPQNVRPPRGGNAGFRGRGRGGRGTFGGDHQNFSGGDPGQSKTIVVEKIPEEHLSLEAVNGWFKRFGTVTNVAVDASGGKALVSFSTHDEARAAWGAQEAVFNNRFVKIFWHRPMEGQGGVGSRALQASATLVANMATQEKEPAPATTETLKHAAAAAPTPAAVSTPKTAMTSKLTALQLKQQLLEKQIAEQKELMAKLGTATPEEKKEIMTRLRKLAAEMKAPSAADTVATTPAKTTPARAAPARAAPAHGSDDKERRARELLDMELDMHARAGEDNGPSESEETPESLQEKLAKLRAEASALGISDAALPSFSPSFRGYRGRGRGRGSYRGASRGGPPRASMKLDNRPKALLVKGVSSQDPDVMQAVRSWYEGGGQLASIDVHDDDSLVVHFLTRAAAEQGLAKGTTIPSAGIVKLGWHNDIFPAKSAPVPQTFTEKKLPVFGDDRPPSPRTEDVPEETGWGNEEDGMGMF